MAESKHTPGPWIAESHGRVYYNPAPGSHTIVAEVRGEATKGQDEANARLIAAAPELLAACEKLLIFTEGEGDALDAVCSAREAIAKAKGPELNNPASDCDHLWRIRFRGGRVCLKCFEETQ